MGVDRQLVLVKSPVEYKMAQPPRPGRKHSLGYTPFLDPHLIPPSSLPRMKGRGSNWAEVEKGRLASSQGPVGAGSWQLAAEDPAWRSMLPCLQNFTYKAPFKDKVVKYCKTSGQRMKYQVWSPESRAVCTGRRPMALGITYDHHANYQLLALLCQ